MRRRSFIQGMGAAAIGASPALAATAAPPAVAAAWAQAQNGALPKLGRTDALVVLRSGQTVFEAYGKDHGPAIRHVSWSMAKSITQALAGIAVGEGKVGIDRPMVTLAAAHPQLTLRHLLTMTDGLDWVDSRPDPIQSDDARML